MASEFSGVKKEDHEELGKAVTMYRNLTGKDLSSVHQSIPVHNPEEDAKKKQERAQRLLDEQAKATRQAEEADRNARQIRRKAESGDSVQDENPGPGQPAMVTERAREQGVDRRGEEPEMAHGGGQ